MTAKPAHAHFTSDQHALAAGAIFGLLIKESKDDDGVLDKAVPVLDEANNYKPYVDVEAFGKRFRVIVAELP